MKLKDKTKNIVIPFLGIVVILSLWYGEKTKRIPQYGTTFYELGLHCKGQCGQDKRVYYFKKAIHNNPYLSGAYYQLALIYENMGEKNRSLEYYRKVTELNPWNVLAAYHVGRQHFREGSYELALRHFKYCYKQRGCPDDVDYYMAKVYDQRGEYWVASQHYRMIAVLRRDHAAEAYARWIEIIPFYKKPGYWSLSKEIKRLRGRAISRPDLADQLEKIVEEAQIPEALKRE